jgi:hypothetical protein
MASLILGVGEKLESIVKDGGIKIEDLDVILQSKCHGEDILQGPFKELNEEIDETEDNTYDGEDEEE